MAQSTKPICIVIGVGPGNGEALARRFAAEGYAVALVERRKHLIEKLADELPDATAYICDVANEEMVSHVFKLIHADMGAPEVLIYNVGKGVRGSVDKISADDFEQSWRINTLGLFHAARCAIPSMKERGSGAILFTGATASRRGVAGTAAFAPAKMAQRALAELMARYLGPFGIHVSLLIVDGVVEGPETRLQFHGRPNDAFIDPEAIALTALNVVKQDRSAWTFELDIRPFNEKW